jgi:hypothetical protein
VHEKVGKRARGVVEKEEEEDDEEDEDTFSTGGESEERVVKKPRNDVTYNGSDFTGARVY